MSKNHIIICMLTLFAWLLPEPSQGNYMFKHYGVETGLSQSTVFTVIQDRTGFIWL